MGVNADADRAIAELNGRDLDGRALTVNEARPKPERSSGGGGGRSLSSKPVLFVCPLTTSKAATSIRKWCTSRLRSRISRLIGGIFGGPAGVGSLGHPRHVAIADWQGGQIALEAKAAIPSACLWARPAASSRIYYQLALDRAIRCPDPFVRLSGRWLVRQLAPDSSPIDIETMSDLKDQDKLLHAMAWEAANVHLGSGRAAARIAADLNRRSGKWLRTAVKDMAAATVSDWKKWRKSRS